MASTIIVIIAVTLCGLVIGALVVVAAWIRREDRGGTLGVEAPNWISRRVRRLNGVACRDLDPEFIRPARGLVH